MPENSETDVLKPMSFPPAVLARISPELSLQRHLAIGIRPNLRKFEEFRDIEVGEGGLGRYSDGQVNDSSVLGSSVLRSGDTTVICTITGAVLEEDLPASQVNEDAAAVNAVFAQGEERISEDEKGTLKDAAPIYPVVEVERGRVGAPTDEEMILSQRLYEVFLHSGILKKSALKVIVGLRTVDEEGKAHIMFRDEEDDVDSELFPKRTWSYVLNAKIKVFSRSGPLFDLVWASLIFALKNTRLPKAFIDENAADVRIPVKMHGQHTAIREQYQIKCHPVESIPLELDDQAVGLASNFGVVDLDDEALETVEDAMDLDKDAVLLCDLEGEEEEAAAQKTISVVVDKEDTLKSLTIIGPVSNDELRKAIRLAKLRSTALMKN